AYHAFIWNETILNIQRLNFKQIDIDEVALPDQGDIESVFAQFDNDKIALVQYIPVRLPGTAPDPRKLIEARENLCKEISALDRYKIFQFLDLSIVSAMGNEMMVPLLGTSLSQTLLVNSYEFDIVTRFKESSALDLWKYTIAREQQVPEPFRIVLSFL